MAASLINAKLVEFINLYQEKSEITITKGCYDPNKLVNQVTTIINDTKKSMEQATGPTKVKNEKLC